MKKVYGAYREETCIFCGERAICMNRQDLPTCVKHKHDEVDMDKIKCSCGEYLDIKQGKYGSFFLCISCGPMSIAKIKEINEIKPKSNAVSSSNSVYKQSNSTTFNKSSSTNVTIRSDDPDYFDD